MTVATLFELQKALLTVALGLVVVDAALGIFPTSHVRWMP
jgi:hypothetical protein